VIAKKILDGYLNNLINYIFMFMKLLNENITKLLSEGMKYHLDNKIPISENIFRSGSLEFFKLFNEARKLYNNGLLQEINQMDQWFLKTDLGKVGIYEGKKVLLDFPTIIKEAEYQGRDVELNKPSRSSGPKKYQVYVKNEKGNVVKVNFGDAKGGLTAKINNPEARRAFADRHDCKNKKDRTSAGYWSCNIPRYWKLLGGSKNMNTYW
jgi:hypothetical protein